MIRFLKKLMNKSGDNKVNIDINRVKDWILKEKGQYTSFGSLDLLTFISDFYLNYRIKKVDYSEPDSDMLLYQFGDYPVNDKNDLFYINITRQIMIGAEDENFYQISINLIYKKNVECEIKSSNKWCPSIEELANWIDFIKTTDVYRLSIEQVPITFELDVHKI